MWPLPYPTMRYFSTAAMCQEAFINDVQNYVFIMLVYYVLECCTDTLAPTCRDVKYEGHLDEERLEIPRICEMLSPKQDTNHDVYGETGLVSHGSNEENN